MGELEWKDLTETEKAEVKAAIGKEAHILAGAHAGKTGMVQSGANGYYKVQLSDTGQTVNLRHSVFAVKGPGVLRPPSQDTSPSRWQWVFECLLEIVLVCW